MNTSKSNYKKVENDRTFMFRCSNALLLDARKVAAENMMSASAFIRQAIMRNLKTYEGAK